MVLGKMDWEERELMEPVIIVELERVNLDLSSGLGGFVVTCPALIGLMRRDCSKIYPFSVSTSFPSLHGRVGASTPSVRVWDQLVVDYLKVLVRIVVMV